jgi:hypothetical protein
MDDAQRITEIFMNDDIQLFLGKALQIKTVAFRLQDSLIIVSFDRE